jgi:hypothetical protein
MCPSEEEFVTIAKAFVAAWNAHDLDAVVDFLTDDVVARVGPAPAPLGSEFTTGKRHARGQVREQLPGFHAETWDYRASGNKVTWAFEYSSDTWRNMGVDPVEGAVEVIFEGDKIKLWSITVSQRTRQKIWANLT